MATRTRRMNNKQVVSVHTDNSCKEVGVKRTADSMLSEQPKTKRAAFGDLTNAVANKQTKNVAKKIGKKTVQRGGKKKTHVVVAVPKAKAEVAVTSSQPEVAVTSSQPEKADQSWDYIEFSQESRTSSQESNPTSSQSSNTSSPDKTVELLNLKNIQLSQESEEEKDWVDIDAENASDPHQVALYAHHIFEYYKEREAKFELSDFMSRQGDLSENMRAILVDWLVEVQENFELNHETLYLAVKIVDHYLDRNTVNREKLQLIGATALFIACKFDERCPPVLDDFLYICDDAYKREEMITCEQVVLKSIGFDLGIPISYRFLRRYAKCAKASMETLTLARFILEHSLMEYQFVQTSDSKMAAAALLLALHMKKTGAWDATMIHYTGCNQGDLMPLVEKLNKMISTPPNKNLQTVRSKYSHKVFHEVALTSPLSESEITELKESS